MPFDFDAAVVAPFRMQPGLRRLAPGAKQLTPLALDAPALREKLEVLQHHATQALLAQPGFDARPALDALARHAAAEWPEAFDWDGATARARHLRWSIAEGAEPLALDADAPPAIGRCLAALPAPWRLPALLALAFAEDVAIVDAARGTIPWLAVCLPSHWAPETKLGGSFAEVHAPVADSALLVQAGPQLLRLVAGAQRWERFVWTITSHSRLHAHPERLAPERWPAGASRDELMALAQWRTERQTFVPLPALQQAVFTIHVELQPLAAAIATAEQARRLHEAIASMSPAVLAYRHLDQVRPHLLGWLGERAARP